MKLCRYGKAGYEKPGVIDSEGRLRDLSKVVDNIGPNEISPRGLKMLTRVKPETLPPVNGSPRLGVPYVGIGKFVAIGLNYSDHAKEAGLPIPSEPIVFMKATTCISGPNDDVIQPKNSTKLDWEVELGVVIGTQAKYVSEADALEPRRRLLRRERRLRARLPDGDHAVGQGQGLRHRRADRPVARHHRRDPATRRRSTCGST